MQSHLSDRQYCGSYRVTGRMDIGLEMVVLSRPLFAGSMSFGFAWNIRIFSYADVSKIACFVVTVPHVTCYGSAGSVNASHGSPAQVGLYMIFGVLRSQSE